MKVAISIFFTVILLSYEDAFASSQKLNMSQELRDSAEKRKQKGRKVDNVEGEAEQQRALYEAILKALEEQVRQKEAEGKILRERIKQNEAILEAKKLKKDVVSKVCYIIFVSIAILSIVGKSTKKERS